MSWAEEQEYKKLTEVGLALVMWRIKALEYWL
jgi:hypothetical protein